MYHHNFCFGTLKQGSRKIVMLTEEARLLIFSPKLIQGHELHEKQPLFKYTQHTHMGKAYINYYIHTSYIHALLDNARYSVLVLLLVVIMGLR